MSLHHTFVTPSIQLVSSLQALIPVEFGPIPFTIGCFVFRILTSLAETSGDVAAHSIATHSFPGNPATAYVCAILTIFSNLDAPHHLTLLTHLPIPYLVYVYIYIIYMYTIVVNKVATTELMR